MGWSLVKSKRLISISYKDIRTYGIDFLLHGEVDVSIERSSSHTNRDFIRFIISFSPHRHSPEIKDGQSSSKVTLTVKVTQFGLDNV